MIGKTGQKNVCARESGRGDMKGGRAAGRGGAREGETATFPYNLTFFGSRVPTLACAVCQTISYCPLFMVQKIHQRLEAAYCYVFGRRKELEQVETHGTGTDEHVVGRGKQCT